MAGSVETPAPERISLAPRPAVLGVLAAVALGACVGSAVLAATNQDLYQPALRTALVIWVTLPYVLAGLVAWRRRPASRFGPLLIMAGFTIQLSILQWSTVPLLNTVGQLCDLVLAAILMHVFLAYPSGRLTDRLERGVVLTAYAAGLGLQIVILMLGGFDDRHLLTIVRNQALAETVQNVQLVLLAILLLIATVLLWRRSRVMPLARRRRPAQIMINCFALSMVMLAALLISGAFQLPGFEVLRLVTFGVVGLAPIAFLAGLLDTQLARAGIGDLLVRLRTDPAPELRELLAETLRDPSLELLYWLPQYGTWADRDGRPAALPEADQGRGVTFVEQSGDRLAALVYDGSLGEEPQLVAAVSAAAGIALENGRLQAELRARLRELEGSRSRVMQAEQDERRRLERNLHDGAQQRLVALALELGLLAEQPGTDDATREQIQRARAEVARSLAELRDVARGLHPAVVTSHGLNIALDSLAQSTSLDLRLHAEPIPRLPEPVEVVAYYVVSESLANAAKHARASRVDIDVDLTDGTLVVQVVDDGVGGADTERGTGLRGLADRVEALGGRLRIWSTSLRRAPRSGRRFHAGSDRRRQRAVAGGNRAPPAGCRVRGHRPLRHRCRALGPRRCRTAGCGHRRHPAAAFPYRRGHPGRTEHPARPSRGRGTWCCPSTSRSASPCNCWPKARRASGICSRTGSARSGSSSARSPGWPRAGPHSIRPSSRP